MVRARVHDLDDGGDPVDAALIAQTAQATGDKGGIQEPPICPFATVACLGPVTSGTTGHTCRTQLPSTPREPPALGNPCTGFAGASVPVHAHTQDNLSLQVPQLKQRDHFPKFRSLQTEQPVMQQEVPSMAASASAADPYHSQVHMMQQQHQQWQLQQLEHQQSLHQQRRVGGLEQLVARACSDMMEQDSLGNSVEPYLITPAQLRDSGDWSVHAPPTDDNLPQYGDIEHPKLPCRVTNASLGFEPVAMETRFCHSRSLPPRKAPAAFSRCRETQPSCNIIEEGVEGGQECFESSLHVSQISKIPTPARSHRVLTEASMATNKAKCREVGVQVNRNSIEGYVQRQQQRCQQEDQSVPLGGGDPVETPDVGLEGMDSSVARPDSAHGRETALLQILTQTLCTELEELYRAWGLNTAGQDQSVRQMKMYHHRLQKVARAIAQQSAMELVVPSEVTEPKEFDTKENLQRANEKLEAEIANTEKRITEMAHLVQGKTGQEAAEALLQDLVVEMRNAIGHDLSSVTAVASPTTKLNAEQWVMQLSILDVWFQQVFKHFGETEHRLEERGQEAFTRAFAHLPGGTAEPRRALLSLR